jgi:apolipoprotein N-acyltransferase
VSAATRRAVVLIAAGALLLVVSYPPFRLAPLTPALSFIAVTPAVLLLAGSTHDPRNAFRLGFWYGLAANALVLYWLIVALWRFTKLSALGFLATVLTLALFTGGLFWFLARLRQRLPRVPLWVTFPIAWTALEWAVGHLGDVRFPWLGLGTSLADAPVLAQWADLAGARGLTLWLAWSGCFLADRLSLGEWDDVVQGEPPPAWSWRWYLIRRLAPVAATVLIAAGYGAWRMQTLPLRDVGVVGLVQPNVPYDEKWRRRADDIVAELLELTERLQASARPDLIIWPEAAIPGYVQNEPDWDRAIGAVARGSHTPLLTGALYADIRGPGDFDYFNAALLYDSTGAWRSNPIYKKRFLVPIVERVPFLPPKWFGNLRFFGGFGRGAEYPVYQVGIGRFGVAVCYESAFEEMARAYRRHNADFLVNVTNDAWYGLTSAPYQHESHLVLRAIETRMGIARAANSGISELLDPLGRAYLSTRLEQQTVVAGVLRTSDVVPLYVRWGDWVGIGVVVATVGLALVLLVTRRR